MTRQELLAEMILQSRTLAERYFAGFTDANRTRQAPNLPNHFAWCLGHLALTMHRVAEKLDGAGLPETDFRTGGTPSGGGDAHRFATESVSFGSRPTDDPRGYPTVKRCKAIFASATERCAAAFRCASDAALDRPAKWGPVEVPTWALAPRMVFHNGDHTGQIADLRRALGLGTVLG